MTATDINELHFEYRIALCNAFHFFNLFWPNTFFFSFHTFAPLHHLPKGPSQMKKIVTFCMKHNQQPSRGTLTES